MHQAKKQRPRNKCYPSKTLSSPQLLKFSPSLSSKQAHQYPISHAYRSPLYYSPHQELQALEVQQVFLPDLQPIAPMDTDSQFLGLCASGRYRIRDRAGDDIGGPRGNLLPCDVPRRTRITEKFPIPPHKAGELRMSCNFEGANPCQCIMVDSNQYLILLRNDTNTAGYTQWFQFYLQRSPSCCLMKSPEKQMIKFVIGNIRKKVKFVEGMKLLTRRYSQYSRLEKWERNLDFVIFQTQQSQDADRKYFGLAFCIPEHQLAHGLFVSLNYPYPLSRLNMLRNKLSKQSQFVIKTIGRSLLENPIHLFKYEPYPTNKRKRNVVIICRQHSSEVSSSYICEFLLKKIAYFNNSPHIYNLCWHIIPIANPDGVVHGNSRTNIRGYDINRCWSSYLHHVSPQVQSIYSYLQSLPLTPQDILIDIHSHGRDLGTFTFSNIRNEFTQLFTQRLQQSLPYFSIQKCRIGFNSTKRNTFRVQMLNKFKLHNVITLQTSFYGFVDSTGLVPFRLQHFQSICQAVIQAVGGFVVGRGQRSMGSGGLGIQGKMCGDISDSQSDSNPQGDYLINQQLPKKQKHQLVNFTEKPQPNQNPTNPNLNLNNHNINKNNNNEHYSRSIQTTKTKSIKNIKNQKNLNIVNLYQGSKQPKDKRVISQRAQHVYSAEGDQRSQYTDRISYSSTNHHNRVKSKEVIVFSNKTKTETMDQDSKFVLNQYRTSFKKLFANAQQRYFQQTQRLIKSLSKQQLNKQQVSRSTLKYQQALQSIKTIDPPFNLLSRNTEELNQLYSILRRKNNNNPKIAKQFQIHKKSKERAITNTSINYNYHHHANNLVPNFPNHNTSTNININNSNHNPSIFNNNFNNDRGGYSNTNDKIARLCEYAKSINGKSAFQFSMLSYTQHC